MASPSPTARRGQRPASRRRAADLVTVGAVLALLTGAAACGRSDPVQVAAAPTTTTAAPTTTTPPTTAAPKVIPVEDGWYLTATPKGAIGAYDAPNGTKTADIDNNYYGIPTSLPVFEQAEDWVHVRLAPKPNGTTAWLKVGDVDIGKTPWKIVVNLATTHLQAFKAGALVLDAPVGIGTDYTPTVTGDFFVTFLQKPTSAAYGPFVMITSGHSDVIKTWEGFPDGILGIHGPIGSDAMIGTTGAKMSNGCIRMHVEDQKQLAEVLPGSPLQIIAGDPAPPATEPAATEPPPATT